MRKQTVGLLLGGFAVYEFYAWHVNGQRVAQSLATTGVVPELLPLDLIGRFFGYPSHAPEAFTPANFPGVAANVAPVPQAPESIRYPDLIDPNNILPLPPF